MEPLFLRLFKFLFDLLHGFTGLCVFFQFGKLLMDLIEFPDRHIPFIPCFLCRCCLFPDLLRCGFFRFRCFCRLRCFSRIRCFCRTCRFCRSLYRLCAGDRLLFKRSCTARLDLRLCHNTQMERAVKDLCDHTHILLLKIIPAKPLCQILTRHLLSCPELDQFGKTFDRHPFSAKNDLHLFAKC